MSRETLDAEGPGSGAGPEPLDPATDLDLQLDDGLPAAPPAAPPSALPPAGPPSALPPADHLEPGPPGTGPAGADGPEDLGFDLGEERTDPRAAARAAGGPLLPGVDRRRLRQAAAVAGVLLLLVLAALGGYSEGQRTQARDALAIAQVVGTLDENVLQGERDERGALVEPIRMTVRLAVTASVTATVVRLVLPTGEARPTTTVVLRPGAGTDAPLELRGACSAAARARPQVSNLTATLRTPDGTEATVPLVLGFGAQLLGREFLCGDGLDRPRTVPLQVAGMTSQVDGTVEVTLQNTGERELQVSAVPSENATSGENSWTVQATDDVVVVPTDELATVRLRVGARRCLPGLRPENSQDLVALRVSGTGVNAPVVTVNGTAVPGWDDFSVSVAAVAAMTRLCTR